MSTGRATAAPPGRAGRGSRLRNAGIAAMVLGALIGVGGMVVAFAPLRGDPPARVDPTATLTAEAGSELALYRIQGEGSEGVCQVVGPDGTRLDPRSVFGTETLTLGSTVYRVAGEVTVVADGVQTVTCSGSGFAVGPRIGVFGLVGSVLLAGFAGIGLFVAGVVMVVIGINRGRTPAAPPGPWQDPPPSGWQQGPPGSGWPQGPPPPGWQPGAPGSGWQQGAPQPGRQQGPPRG